MNSKLALWLLVPPGLVVTVTSYVVPVRMDGTVAVMTVPDEFTAKDVDVLVIIEFAVSVNVTVVRSPL